MLRFMSAILFAIFLLIPTSAIAEDWNRQLHDSIHFAKNGNDVTVDTQKMKLSLSNGANPNWINSKDKRNESILSYYVLLSSISNDPKASAKGVEALQILFQNKAKLQYCDGAILFFPIAHGKYDIVKLLLKNGANATSWPYDEIGDGYKFTPVEEATARGYDQIVNLLVGRGAKRPSEKDAAQLRFINAAASGDINELKKQLEQGATVNKKNRNEQTVLIESLGGFLDDYEQYMKIVFLLSKGADVNLRGRSRFTDTEILPLHQVIIQSSFLYKAKRDTSYAEQILQELIKKGAYISATDEDGETPLHMAAQYNNLYAAQLLLDTGSKVMPKDKVGKTPLDYSESAEMIKLLKKYGAKEQ